MAKKAPTVKEVSKDPLERIIEQNEHILAMLGKIHGALADITHEVSVRFSNSSAKAIVDGLAEVQRAIQSRR